MKKKGNWSPAHGLGGIKATREPVIDLSKLNLWSEQAWENADQIASGIFLGGTSFVIGANGCAKPELGLGIGLGATGLAWLITGFNYMAISGVISTLTGYGICKWLDKGIQIAPELNVKP